MTLRVGVSGARGRMGRILVDAIKAQEDLLLAFSADRGDDLGRAVRDTRARVVVDFTVPDAVFQNTVAIIESGASPVVGTTGLSEAQLDTLAALLEERGLGGLVAPNFSLGALLMVKLAETAARYMPSCEIIERHHDHKLDSPSGTARLTAQRIGAVLRPVPGARGDAYEPSRGLSIGPVRIHSVRQPGHMAHQQVLFSGPGETLTISHDLLSRECFLPGVFRAVRDVVGYKGLKRELEI